MIHIKIVLLQNYEYPGVPLVLYFDICPYESLYKGHPPSIVNDSSNTSGNLSFFLLSKEV